MTLARRLLFVATLALATAFGVTAAADQDGSCVPFGGTIYGWHDTATDSWYGVGDFTVGRHVWSATVVDPNTGFSDFGTFWLGTETAKFDFGHGDSVELMTEFICEFDPVKLDSPTAVMHVNETGSFANGKGRFQHAWGRFNLQGPFGPGVKLPPQFTPGTNDGWFWIGQYVGTICGVEGASPRDRAEVTGSGR